MTAHLFRTFCILALSVSLCGVLRAQDTTVVTTTAPVVAPAPVDSEFSAQLTRDLRSDPLFTGMALTVDIYNGLAIVHGGAPSQQMIDAVNEKLRNRKGVEVVFNYMTYPGQPAAAVPQSIAATFDYLDRVRVEANRPSSFVIAGRVLERLRAAPGLNLYDLQVDAYRDLVILHGNVTDPVLATRARDIAQHTDGVVAVLSYIQAAPTVSAYMMAEVEVAPVLSRPVIEPVPARYETIVPIRRSCGFCR